jgi:hypothetical protein
VGPHHSRRRGSVRSSGNRERCRPIGPSELTPPESPDQGVFTRDPGKRKIAALYVFKLDRLCRTGVADTFKIVSELRAAGVTLHAVADNLVIKPGHDDIVSETLVFALSLPAKLERAAINDRIAAARTRMDAAGQPWGPPPGDDPGAPRDCPAHEGGWGERAEDRGGDRRAALGCRAGAQGGRVTRNRRFGTSPPR